MMVRARLLAGAALLIGVTLVANDAASQQTTGPYVLGGIGLNYLQDSDVKGGAVSSEAEFKLGPAIIGAVGYGFGNGFRAEFELGWRSNSIDKVDGVDGDGTVRQGSAMLNALYDIPLGMAFTPYLGAGLGVARVSVDDARSFTGSRVINQTEYEYAYQGIVGVAYALAPQWKIDLSYRYFATTDVDLRTNDGVAVDAENRNHTVLLALRYEFGAPKPPMAPAAVTPPPPPAAAPAPVQAAPPAAAPAIQRSYLVFFDWDKSDITAEARRVIQQAADNAKRGNVSRIQATGHADRSGSDRYNMALSLRRANAVKAELVRAGIPESQIAVLGRGETQPLVPTADGVREPQNRRVEILLQ